MMNSYRHGNPVCRKWHFFHGKVYLVYEKNKVIQLNECNLYAARLMSSLPQMITYAGNELQGTLPCEGRPQQS